jgi:hypothetical protein
MLVDALSPGLLSQLGGGPAHEDSRALCDSLLQAGGAVHRDRDPEFLAGGENDVDRLRYRRLIV